MLEGRYRIPVGEEPAMLEPDEDLKKFEEGLKKPRTSSVKKDRIVTCPGCGKKQTVMQVRLGEEVKCKSCGQMFEIKKELSQDAHLVTMAAVDLQVKQMEFMQRVGKVAPPAKKKITVARPQVKKTGGTGRAVLKIILWLIALIALAVAILVGLHAAGIVDIQPYLDKLKVFLGL
jgi:transcription elongation factor Elf1